MSRIFCLVVIIILVVLAFVEIGRYLAARRSADEFPYPPRRLARRLGVTFLFSSIVALVAWWPQIEPRLTLGVRFALLGYVLVGLALGLALLWRDLRETSQAAVAHATRLNAQTSEAFQSLLRQMEEEKNRVEAPEVDNPQRN